MPDVTRVSSESLNPVAGSDHHSVHVLRRRNGERDLVLAFLLNLPSIGFFYFFSLGRKDLQGLSGWQAGRLGETLEGVQLPWKASNYGGKVPPTPN